MIGGQAARGNAMRDAIPIRFPALELTVRDPNCGTVLARLVLDVPSQPAITHGTMQPPPSVSGAGTDAEQNSIAGKITPAPNDIEAAVAAWIEHLQARRQKPNGYNAYRQKVQRLIEDRGLRTCSQLTTAEITAWMNSHGDSWCGKTYNGVLSAIRSFTRYLYQVDKLPADPLDKTARAFEEQADGARAARTSELKAILRTTWMRQSSDARCKGDRLLYWGMLMMAACRLDEPGRLRRRHMLLDEDTPIIRWTPDINKNRRLQEIVLAPELVPLLLRQREEMRELARSTPIVDRFYRGKLVDRRLIDPADPEAFVFPIVPSPSTFPADRNRAGVPRLDSRGRSLSSHSCRKWFATTLVGEGVDSRMVDCLMRHSSGVPGLYHDPPLSDQVAAIARLPRIWPEIVDNSCVNRGTQDFCLTKWGEIPDSGRGHATDPAQPEAPLPPGRADTRRLHDVASARPGDTVASHPERPIRSRRGDRPVESSTPLNPGMALSGLINGTIDPNALADLFGVLERLLRSGAVSSADETSSGEKRA